MTHAGDRARAHVAEVRRRLAASRYDGDAGELDALLGRLGPRAVWTRGLAGDPVPPARLLPPTALRVAATPLDLERSAEVISAAAGEDLDVVRRHLGGNLRQVDGASVLLAVRWDEDVVGTATLVLADDAGGTVAGVHAVAVAPTFAGRGIGRALLVRALELATGAGADLAVATWPAGDRSLLPHLGFTPLDGEPFGRDIGQDRH